MSRKGKKKNDGKIRLVFTYNEGNPPLYQWMREAKRCLVRNDKAKELGDLIQISHKQPRNMKRTVTANNSRVLKGAQPTPHAGEPGCFKCNKGCKVSCPILREGATFRSTKTNSTYFMHMRLT